MHKGQFQKGHCGYWKGKKQSPETLVKRRESMKKLYKEGLVSFFKGKDAWNKGMKIQTNSGVTHFKKGQTPWNKLNRTPEEIREIRRAYRKANPLQFKAYDQRKRSMRKDLTGATVQLVYEDNIKKYGTLTCYLCLKPIPFGKDQLEHKIPLVRGGSNNYDNLAIACKHCNCTKHSKTIEEFQIAGIR